MGQDPGSWSQLAGDQAPGARILSSKATVLGPQGQKSEARGRGSAAKGRRSVAMERRSEARGRESEARGRRSEAQVSALGFQLLGFSSWALALGL